MKRVYMHQAWIELPFLLRIYAEENKYERWGASVHGKSKNRGKKYIGSFERVSVKRYDMDSVLEYSSFKNMSSIFGK